MFVIFGKDDDIFLPELHSDRSILGSKIIYTEPNYVNFMTNLGFHIPLNGNGIPYVNTFSDKIPYLPIKFERENYILEYLYISPEGDLWIINLNYQKDKNSFLQNEEFIFHKNNGWWMLSENDEPSLESKMLAGFLSTNPNTDSVEKYCFQYLGGIKLLNMKISELVKKYEEINQKIQKENTSEE